MMPLRVSFSRVGANISRSCGTEKQRFPSLAQIRYSKRLRLQHNDRRCYNSNRGLQKAGKYDFRFVSVTCGILCGVATSAFVFCQQDEERFQRQDEDAEPESEIDIKSEWEDLILHMQDEICSAIVKLDGTALKENNWTSKEGDGERTFVLQDGNVFEKASVGVSIVHGVLSPEATEELTQQGVGLTTNENTNLSFYTAGINLVMHPLNPFAPTVHLNYRYFEVRNSDTGDQKWWFGGGSDLAPAYLFEDDAIDFHTALKEACDRHDPSFYRHFKERCDRYYFIKHRGESRGIGGIFFDDLNARPGYADLSLSDKEAIMKFSQDCLETFVPTYFDILRRRIGMPFNSSEKQWQQLRRGRYIEFDLLYDRGTRFRLQPPGSRMENILMSLPLNGRWEYQHKVLAGSKEEKLLKALQEPKDWASDPNELKQATFEQLLGELSRRQQERRIKGTISSE